jgi:hypothetical protein
LDLGRKRKPGTHIGPSRDAKERKLDIPKVSSALSGWFRSSIADVNYYLPVVDVRYNFGSFKIGAPDPQASGDSPEIKITMEGNRQNPGQFGERREYSMILFLSGHESVTAYSLLRTQLFWKKGI